ncbi:MAG: hypothetical protein ACE5KV_09135 [Thermoplasmata archaeon]
MRIPQPQKRKDSTQKFFKVDRRRAAYLSAVLLVSLLTMLSLSQFISYSSEKDIPVKVKDETDRWTKPRQYVEPLPNGEEFTSEELSSPRVFSTRSIRVFFPLNESPGIGIAISPGDPAGNIDFYSPNGTLLNTVRWSKPSPGLLGASLLDMPRRFEGGELWMDINGTGIFLFHNRTLRDKYLLSGNQMEWVSMHNVDTFCLPLVHSDEIPLDKRLTARISVVSVVFSARIYDDNFHLLAEINDAKSASRELAMGESSTAFFVIYSEIGETIDVYLYYSPVVSPPALHLPIFLLVEIIVLIILIWRYVSIFHLRKRKRRREELDSNMRK